MFRTKDACIENLLLVSRKHISNSLYIILKILSLFVQHNYSIIIEYGDTELLLGLYIMNGQIAVRKTIDEIQG